jgi:hypothetical protein
VCEGARARGIKREKGGSRRRSKRIRASSNARRVCVCVRERERERASQKDNEWREREIQKETKEWQRTRRPSQGRDALTHKYCISTIPRGEMRAHRPPRACDRVKDAYRRAASLAREGCVCVCERERGGLLHERGLVQGGGAKLLASVHPTDPRILWHAEGAKKIYRRRKVKCGGCRVYGVGCRV